MTDPTSNPKTLEELQMDTRPPTWRNHRDSFQTAGDLRSAATDLCMALKGTPHHDLAAQIHDSLVMALPRGSHVPIGRAALSGDSSAPETKSYSCEIDGPHHYECKHCHIPLPGLSQETTKHYCASCGAEGEPGSPKYCSADCAEKASTKP